ncbi:MAG: maleylacetoacetate isomerase [Oligoflexia bacterium]|nr:maleylacetoacetate isomerase [Oligoflexia bacterium]
MRYRLYHYWRSSASWRARWALALKEIEVEYVAVDLLSDDAESPEHRHRNPLGFVPVLELLEQPEDSPYRYLTESTALLEWMEETRPFPSLLPSDPLERARIRALCQIVNASLQPLQNPPVTARHSSDPEEAKKWVQYWNQQHLKAFEELARPTAGKFCFGDEITMADLFLIPQCYSARRFGVPLDQDFPMLARIYDEAMKTPECQRTSPDALKPSV